MYDMMLGPCGAQFWAGDPTQGNVMPQARFHMDWSRVAFPAAVQIDPLYAFSYAIGQQQPGAITAAIGATQADIFDTSITQEGTLSKTCILTHLGVAMDTWALVSNGAAADVATTFAATQVARPRLAVRVFWAERTNEEAIGLLEDFPSGLGTKYLVNAAYAFAMNGDNAMSAIKPLPRPLPCKGGDTYFRVVFEPTVRDGGITFATITSFNTRVYGVSPAKIQPSEAPHKAMQQLSALQNQTEKALAALNA